MQNINFQYQKDPYLTAKFESLEDKDKLDKLFKLTSIISFRECLGQLKANFK
jgi:hypothetical protein